MWLDSTVNVSRARCQTKHISLQQVVLQSRPVLVSVAELFKNCIWNVQNIYIYIKLIFNSFPFSSVCYRSLYYSVNTPVGTCCCVIKGWGAEAAQHELTQVFETEQFGKQSKS